MPDAADLEEDGRSILASTAHLQQDLELSASDHGVDALALWDDNGNGRITCDEARAHGIAPVRRGHPAYQYMNDADGDGIVCE